MATASNVRKRRGTVRGSITRLTNRLSALEDQVAEPSTFDLAQGLATKLAELDQEFRRHHYQLLDLIDEGDEEALRQEQTDLDGHDDAIDDASMRIKRLIQSSSSSNNSSRRQTLARQQTQLERSVVSIRDAVTPLTAESDTCLVQQYQKRLQTHKADWRELSSTLLSMNLEDTDALNATQNGLEKLIFDCDLRIRRLLPNHTSSDAPPPPASGVKLPKLEAPKFDGKYTNWISFWEQFDVAIHGRTSLSDVEKLAYLRNSVKDGSTKGIIEGLSTSGEFYAEAIDTLKARYNRPRLIHQSHVRIVLDAPPVKEGTGRELRQLHDTVRQHLRALKSMGCEPSGPFITSILELKLDDTTSFEWQKYSQDLTDFPHYSDMLAFLDLRAQAAEASTSDSKKERKGGHKSMHSFTGGMSDTLTPTCSLCKTEKHFLFSCPQFKALAHDDKMSTVKSSDLCVNCLRPGHFVKHCRSTNRCRRCQKSHHTLLHVEQKADPISPTPVADTNMYANASTTGGSQGSILMTCRVLATGPDGSSIECRALLDSASSASFVSERLARGLRLQRSHRSARIHGVAGLLHESHIQSFTNLTISPLQDHHKEIQLSAAIVPRVTCDLPSQRVTFKSEWNHLADLTLADPDFGRPGKIDLLLGVEVFSAVVRQGRRTGHPGSPSAFETDFGWSSQVRRTHVFHTCLCSHIILQLIQMMTYSASSGRLKIKRPSSLVSHLKNALLFCISKNTILVTTVVGS